MNTQELFDKVVSHLLEQGQPALSRTYRCAYRGTEGRQCAVGCLITDNNYAPFLEGCGVASPRVQEAVMHSIGHQLTEYEALLLAHLQSIHDSELPVDWKDCLWRLAENQELEWNHD